MYDITYYQSAAGLSHIFRRSNGMISTKYNKTKYDKTNYMSERIFLMLCVQSLPIAGLIYVSHLTFLV
jgi:hypothetical protein